MYQFRSVDFHSWCPTLFRRLQPADPVGVACLEKSIHGQHNITRQDLPVNILAKQPGRLTMLEGTATTHKLDRHVL